MTVANSLNKHTYIGNGATIEWAYTFKIFKTTDIQVILTEIATGVDAILTNNYTVDPVNSIVLYPVVGVPLTATYKITLNRAVPITQETALPNGGPYLAKTIETAFDKGIIIEQQQQEQLSRSLLHSVSVGTDVSNELPAPVPLHSFRWDSTGKKLELALDPGSVVDAAIVERVAAQVARAGAETAQGAAEIAEDGATTQAGIAITKVAEATAQVVLATAQKVIATTQAEIATAQALAALGIASGSPKGGYNTLALLQAAFPTGTTGIYIVVADGKWYYWSGAWVAGGPYQGLGFADGSIDISALKFMITGKNMFNKYSCDFGFIMSDGNIQVDVGNMASNFMKIKNSTYYITNLTAGNIGALSIFVGFYDSSRTFISRTIFNSANIDKFLTPANAMYLKVSMPLTLAATFQVEEGQVASAYEDYYCWIKNLLMKDSNLPDNIIMAKHILNNIIGPEKTKFFTAGTNLVDAQAIVPAGFISNATGVFTSNVAYRSSDYIAVTGSTNIILSLFDSIGKIAYNKGFIAAYYDSAKSVVSGIAMTTITSGSYSLTTPSNAKYIRFSVDDAAFILLWMMEIGTVGSSKYSDRFTLRYQFDTSKLSLSDLVSKEWNINFYNASLQTSLTISDNKFISSGNLNSGAEYFVPAPTYIEPNRSYILSHAVWGGAGTGTRGAIYDINGTFISAFDSITFNAPANAAYIRMSVLKAAYTLDFLNKNLMIVKGSAIPNTYVPYGSVLPINISVSPQIKNEITPEFFIKNSNLIDETLIIADSFVNYTNGLMSTASGASASYRASAEYLEVDETKDYIFSFFDITYSMVKGNLLGGYYNNLKAFIGGLNVGEGYGFTLVDGNRYKLTFPAGTKYVRLSFQDQYVPGYWLLEQASVGGGYQPKGSILRQAFSSIAKDNVPKIFEALKGQIIVNFGDSIIGNVRDDTSVSGKIHLLGGAKTYNCGFGGCRMAAHSPYWDAFSMYRIADAIISQDFTLMDAALASGSGLLSYFGETVARIKSINFNDVDFITISYGTNDYTAGVLTDNISNPEDVTTYAGALRYTLRRLFTAYPTIKILVCTPSYRFWSDGSGVYINDGDTQQYAENKILPDFVNMAISVAKEFKTPYLDQYRELDINKYNRLASFSAIDGTHHQEPGRLVMAKAVCNSLVVKF